MRSQRGMAPLASRAKERTKQSDAIEYSENLAAAQEVVSVSVEEWLDADH